MYQVRSYRALIPSLRTMYVKGRDGIVVDKIKTKDIDEAVNSLLSCFEQLDIAPVKALNKVICMRRNQDEYCFIFMIKTNMKEYVHLFKLGQLQDKNVKTFRDWY